jgi:diguanylate cyclase (GGDEF)-like protein
MYFIRKDQVLERHYFDYQLNLEVNKAARYLYFFTLLVIQPSANDAGRDTSKNESITITETIAGLIRDEIRGTDVVGKVDGDQFFAILHQADHQEARMIGERILQRVANYTFVIKDQEIQKRINIGGVCFPTHANGIDGLIAKAKEMLDRSMIEGGNKVSLPG